MESAAVSAPGAAAQPRTSTSKVSSRSVGPPGPRRARRRRREIVVVVNGRSSGVGDPERALARVQRELREAGALAAGAVTASEQELAVAVEGADGRRVALVGGDGSLHAAVNLPLPPPELAIVPAGRANNVARAFGIPTATGLAAAIAVAGAARPVDLLRTVTDSTSLLCVEALSAGLQAAARHGYEGRNSADVGAGARVLLDAVRDYRPYPIALTDGGQLDFAGRAAQVFLSNLPFFGFGFKVDPMARPSDGMLEAVVLQASSRRQAFARLLAVHGGRHVGREWALIRRVREARLEGPLPLVADSRPLGTGSATVSVVGDRLRLVTP